MYFQKSGRNSENLEEIYKKLLATLLKQLLVNIVKKNLKTSYENFFVSLQKLH